MRKKGYFLLKFIDLGCDVGESFGVYSYGYDEEVMEFISSANIACGFHAGDPSTMRKTIDLAVRKGVAVGAHPGLPDLLGFGRRMMNISPSDACDYITYQMGALEGMCRMAGAGMGHVKFHGALIRMSATDRTMARALSERIKSFKKDMVLVAFSGSALEEAGMEAGLPVAAEVLIDRGYDSAGNVLPLARPGGVVRDPRRILRQVEEVVCNSRLITAEDGFVPLKRVHTMGFHFGTTGIDLVREIRSRLESLGVEVAPACRILQQSAG